MPSSLAEVCVWGAFVLPARALRSLCVCVCVLCVCLPVCYVVVGCGGWDGDGRRRRALHPVIMVIVNMVQCSSSWLKRPRVCAGWKVSAA